MSNVLYLMQEKDIVFSEEGKSDECAYDEQDI